MTYRNILVLMDETAVSRMRLTAAAGIAGRFGASLTGLFLRSGSVAGYVAGDSYTATAAVEAFIAEREEHLAKASHAARAAFDEEVKKHGLKAGWMEIDGDDDISVLAAVRRFDLTIFPHTATSPGGAHAITASHIGMGSGAPVLVLPERGYPIPFGRKVLVAWKESRESTRAMRDALPFLSAAEEVHFVSVARDAPADFDDSMRRYLEAHGCKQIRMHADHNSDLEVGNAILRHSGRVGADLIVLGLYGHSRMRELLLGGVSRDMLGSLVTPLLVSH